MKMTPREKLLVSLLFVVFLMWVEYTYLLKDLWASYELTQIDLTTYEQKLLQLNTAPDTIKKLEVKLAENKEQTYGLLDQHFTTTEQEELILLLTDLSEGTGVSLSRIVFSEPAPLDASGLYVDTSKNTESEATLFQMPVDITCTGTYDNMIALLRKVWGFQKRIAVDQLTLMMDMTDTTLASNILGGDLTLHFYYTQIPEGTPYNDKLYQWMIDDTFFKGNPFSTSAGEKDFRVNYVFTGGKDLEANAYTPFVDIKGHWAEAEINNFGENGYIKRGQNDTFGPDTPMTRGEFIIMMDGIYKWPVPEVPADLTQFTDYDELGSYENAISKAVMKGLLGGYVVGFDDNTLRPKDPITYSDVEFIMKRIKNDEAFTWDTVAAKLLADKGVNSEGIADKNAQMTKAEAVYLMTNYK